ncbi:hypothetical protein OIV83_004400 [Microbotryomycetes sp. JL201]|nr:hypothetical protein OIV83_004400 [Microbotryomycetes sp. JL201]
MSEAVTYADSPFAQYLQDAGVADESIVESVDKADEGLQRTVRREIAPQRDGTVATITANPKTEVSSEFAEQLKYALATSALLTPRLAEALSLYRLDQGLSSERSSQMTLTRPANVAVWGREWEIRGQTLVERSLGQTIELAVRKLADVLARLSGTATAVTKPSIPISLTSATLQTREPPAWQTQFMAALDHFVRASQRFDLNATRGISGVREIECVAWGFQLSDPMPPISRIEVRPGPMMQPASSPLSRSQSQPTPRPRLPSPLTMTPPRTNGVKSLQAAPTRNALIQSIESLSLLFLRISASIETLSGVQRPLETSDLFAELPIERQAEERNRKPRTSDIIPITRKASQIDRSKRMSWGAETSSSQLSDMTFGGIDRKVGLSPAMRHRSRPSLGSISVSSHGEDSLNTPVKGRRRRPASWGVWSGQSVSAALRELGDNDAASEDIEPEDEKLSISTIDRAMQDMYDTRRTLLWRMLELVNKLSTGEKWLKVAALLQDATSEIDLAITHVGTAAKQDLPAYGDELRFGRSALLPRSTRTDESRMAASSGRAAGFAPPGQTFAEKSLQSLEDRQAQVSLVLRTIAAKSQVSMNAVRQIGPGSDDEQIRHLLARHDSIRDDISSLSKAWEESRVALRILVRGEPDTDATDTESIASEGVSTPLDERVTRSELDDPLVEYGEHVQIGVDHANAVPDELEHEEIFEATTEPPAVQPRSKLSREERIKLAHARRREEVASTPKNLEAPMVAELKEVLTSLKGRQQLNM